MQPEPNSRAPGEAGSGVQGQGQAGYAVPSQSETAADSNAGYRSTGQPGYVIQGQQDYGSTGQPIYGVQGPVGSAFPGQPNYGVQGQLWYGAQSQPGYGVLSQPGYGIQSQPGYGVPGMGFGIQPAPVVMVQPGVGGRYPAQVMWMPDPPHIPGCPPGMEYLTQLDQLLIKQDTHFMEVLTGWECKNKFRVMNSVGQQVYYAMEESNICERQLCGSSRGFVYHITDNIQQDVIRVRRHFMCCTGVYCCPCDFCRYFATVEGRAGNILGYISNLTFCCRPLFGIFDSQKNMIAKIQGPTCPFQTICCTDDIVYQVFDVATGLEIGMICKQWPGVLKEMFTDSDNFRVSFPAQMDVNLKALMFAAVFIIDIMLYEKQGNSIGI